MPDGPAAEDPIGDAVGVEPEGRADDVDEAAHDIDEAAHDIDEVVPGTLDGERVDRAVALLTGLTRAEVNSLIDDGAVVLDGRTVAVRGRRVRSGQTLAVTVPPIVSVEVAPAPDPAVAFSVVHADADVIVVDKPAGLVVHPGAGNRTGTLVHGLLARYPDLAGQFEPGAEDRPGIVHRLDKGTSGLLVVARTAEARRSLVAQLVDHSLRRVYDTLVVGTVDSDEGVVDAPLGRSGRDPTRITVDAGGRASRTLYRVESRYTSPGPATLLECRLETGRTHQIRVHLAAIGHPVVGDDRYGRDAVRQFGGWRPPAGRPFLHARQLAFIHPRSAELVTFEVPLPADLAEVLAGFR
jgi:23S rRNA pseudouridine1911/1915/1917 synthase